MNLGQLSIEEKQFLKRLEERLTRVQRRHQTEVSDFIEPGLQAIARTYLQSQGQPFLLCSASAEAERKKLLVYPDYLEADCTLAEVTLIKLSGNFQYVRVNHRDFLGAVLSMGVKREKFGDFYVVEDGCFLETTAEMADYLISHCPKIKGVTVTVAEVDPKDWEPLPSERQMIQTTVSSWRLDTIVAHGFNLSRTGAIALIQGGKVQVNHLEVGANDYLCGEGDILSVRGKGKLKIGAADGESKKGKLRINLWKYI